MILFSNFFSTESHENPDHDISNKSSFSIDIKTKEVTENDNDASECKSTNIDAIRTQQGVSVSETQHQTEIKDEKTPKEKQCWSLYCKMVEKGVNVSFDTILRGMLTPTEYRMSKKNFAKHDEEGGEENPPPVT